jgi:hypothetical protein
MIIVNKINYIHVDMGIMINFDSGSNMLIKPDPDCMDDYWNFASDLEDAIINDNRFISIPDTLNVIIPIKYKDFK